MREVNVQEITDNIKEMCIEANHFLTDDMKNVFEKAVNEEEAPLGKQVLKQLEENLKIAGEDMIPICQDTGMAVVFINVGQDVHFTGGNITDAINEGVRRGYVDGYLRKSVVKDPIYRENTKDNTPAVIHFNIVPGDKVDITYNNKNYTYIITNIYTDLKDGDVAIKRNKNKTTLTLITCTRGDKTTQTIYICERI